jgi:hypothetical protein
MFYSPSTRGFYSTELHGNNIPADVVEITDAEHAALLEGQSQGKMIVPGADGKPIPQDPPKPALADYKSQAQNAIDQAAGLARARYITVAPGQEATYQAKAAEADAYVAAGSPADTTPYPILAAEAQARGISVSDMAELVRTTRDQWTQLAATIEGMRIGGKLAVDAAADHASVDAAKESAVAQLEAV